MRKSTIKSIINDIKSNTCHSLEFLLDNDVDSTISIQGIRIRKAISPIVRLIFRGQSDYKFKLDSKEKLVKDKVGKIFIVNHRQSDDMLFSALAVQESGYFVFGNPILACQSLKNGFGLWLQGFILVNRDDKLSRKSCYEKMKYILLHGENIIIFSEGYWNLTDDGEKDSVHAADAHNSESWLIQDLNIGAFRLSKEISCEIVPTVLHYDEYKDKKCYGKRGNTFKVLDDIFEKKDEVKEEMYKMYYDLMEKYSSYSRELLEKNISLKEQWKNLKDKLISDCDIINNEISYHLDLDDEKRIGKAKVANPVVTEKEVFECLNDIELTNKNAYVLVKTRNKKEE